MSPSYISVYVTCSEHSLIVNDRCVPYLSTFSWELPPYSLRLFAPRNMPNEWHGYWISGTDAWAWGLRKYLNHRTLSSPLRTGSYVYKPRTLRDSTSPTSKYTLYFFVTRWSFPQTTTSGVKLDRRCSMLRCQEFAVCHLKI